MSNVYCTVVQFFYYYDERTYSQLSNDKNQSQANETKLGFLLDSAASELDTYLNGRWSLPLASPPLVLTRWVAVKAADALWGRRTDKPKQLQADAEWAKQFIEKLTNGTASLPGVDRSTVATLDSSDRTDGTSRFDGLPNFSGRSSPTGTGRGL